MTMMPTTDAMIRAAQDAYDVAAADAAVAEARFTVAMAEVKGRVTDPDLLDEVVAAGAKLAVARAARGYALSVLHACRVDHGAVAS